MILNGQAFSFLFELNETRFEETENLAKNTYPFIEIKNDNYILKEEFIMLNIIIAGALVYGVLIGVDKMLNYGKENNLYVEGYLQK